jgi:hypothetical protein
MTLSPTTRYTSGGYLTDTFSWGKYSVTFFHRPWDDRALSLEIWDLKTKQRLINPEIVPLVADAALMYLHGEAPYADMSMSEFVTKMIGEPAV